MRGSGTSGADALTPAPQQKMARMGIAIRAAFRRTVNRAASRSPLTHTHSPARTHLTRYDRRNLSVFDTRYSVVAISIERQASDHIIGKVLTTGMRLLRTSVSQSLGASATRRAQGAVGTESISLLLRNFAFHCTSV